MSDTIRDARSRHGLTIYQLADRLGVTAGAISQLEQSERSGAIKLASLDRALAAMGERLHISASPGTMADRHLMTARSAARAIDDELAASDEASALRIAVQSLEHFRSARTENEIADFLKRPERLRDVRWDTFLATAVAWEAERLGRAAPRWTRRSPLAEEWVPGPDVQHAPDYVAHLRASAEPRFLDVGIVVRERDLQSR
jgi:transcriptional regulator with XRE-family HTH domain